MEEINNESEIINTLQEEWGVEKSAILQTADRFFNSHKKLGNRVKKLDENLLNYQIKYIIADPNVKVGYCLSDHDSPGMYISLLNNFAEELAKTKKGVIFYSEDFIYGLLGDQSLLEEKDLKEFCEVQHKKYMEKEAEKELKRKEEHEKKN